MPTDDGIKYASEFQIDELTLVAVSGASVDLRQVFRELNVFEDLFSNTMTAELFINDSQNLINILPILGGEYIKVTFIKPGTTWKLSKVFRVYKITDRRKSTLSSEDYVLHLCSEELILSESIKISKAYKGMTISAIIKDIARNYLQIDSLKFPATSVTPTTGNFDVVIPFWTPLYTINWLSRMARTGDNPGCSFVFFEDSVGYHFTSIELLSQQAPLQPINFMPMNLAGETGEKGLKSDTQQRFESAEEYEMTKAPDLMRSVSTGMYAGKLVTINPMDQRINVRTLNAAALFEATDHLNDNMFIQFGNDRTRTPQTGHVDSFFRVAADNLRVTTWMLQRNAYMAALHGFQIKVSLPGNMSLRVGQVVTLNMPAAAAPSKESKPEDQLYSGNYLITAIRHKIDRTKYICVLELSKDSIVPQLPEPLQDSGAINKIRQS